MSDYRDQIKEQASATAYMVCTAHGKPVKYTHRDGVSGFSGNGSGTSGFSGFSGSAYFPAVQSDYQKTIDDDTEKTTCTWTIPTCTTSYHGTNFPPNDSNEPTMKDFITDPADNTRWYVMASSTDPLKSAWELDCEREEKRRSR